MSSPAGFPPVDDLGSDETRSSASRAVIEVGDGADQLAAEGPSDGRASWRTPRGRQPIEPGHEGVVQAGRHGQRRQRTDELVAAIALPQRPRLEHHLGQLLDVERHAIDPVTEVADDLVRQGASAGDPLDHGCRLLGRETREIDPADTVARRPRRGGSRAEEEERHDAGSGQLLDDARQQLERGRIDPVQVLHGEEHGLTRRHADDERDQHLERPLLARLRREIEHGVAPRQRERQQLREQRHRVRDVRSALTAASRRDTRSVTESARRSPQSRWRRSMTGNSVLLCWGEQRHSSRR
jgi:hypothetical protein